METVVDKEKSCYKCPDRYVDERGTCHSTCEFYKRRTEANERKKAIIRAQKQESRDIMDSYYKSFGSCKRPKY